MSPGEVGGKVRRPTLGLMQWGAAGGADALAPTHPTVKDFIIQTELGATQGSEPRRDITSLGLIRLFLAEKSLRGTLAGAGTLGGQLLRGSRPEWGDPSQA